MITKVSSTKNGQVVYHFDNGNVLSFIWSYGSYTKNHSDRDKSHNEWVLHKPVECYSIGKIGSKVTKYIEDHYDGNPGGYIPVSEIPKLLEIADDNN